MLVSASYIAEQFGVSASTVSRWRGRYGLETIKDRTQMNSPRLYDWERVLEQVPHERSGGALLGPAALARQQRLKEIALDLEDLAHQTGRGDVDLVTWGRVCAARLADTDLSNAMHHWRSSLAKMRIPFEVVGEHGEPYVATNEGRPSLMRFDWPNVLRWTRRVLD